MRTVLDADIDPSADDEVEVRARRIQKDREQAMARAVEVLQPLISALNRLKSDGAPVDLRLSIENPSDAKGWAVTGQMTCPCLSGETSKAKLEDYKLVFSEDQESVHVSEAHNEPGSKRKISIAGVDLVHAGWTFHRKRYNASIEHLADRVLREPVRRQIVKEVKSITFQL